MKLGSNLQILLFVLGYVSIVVSVPIFSGNAKADFSGLTGADAARYYNFHDDSYVVAITPWMKSKNYTYGLDVAGVHTYYDERTDTLHQGIECMGICGDSDGDGNPGATDPSNPDYTPDNPNMCEVESIVVMMWNDVPTDYVANASNYRHFFPTLTIGKPYTGCIVEPDGTQGWLSYEWPNYRTCNYDTYKSNPAPASAGARCLNSIRSALVVPSENTDLFDYSLELDQIDDYVNKGVSMPDMYTLYMNFSHPHIEYKLYNYSKYPGFRNDFQPGFDSLRITLETFSGNNGDQVGEDRTPPYTMQIDYDCFSVPGGSAKYDSCGVCDGNNQTCWDCAEVPNGPSRYDACGVCGGHNETCLDCHGVANGPDRYDACGVCAGHNETCLDCMAIANGPNRYDACGVCAGHNETCVDCSGVANGPDRYDSCGVCAGDNSTCLDCFGVANGPSRYDSCGVCDGTNSTCLDCAGIANGGNVYDYCGVCNGTNTTCQDCFGVPKGNATYDGCGVCGGANETCTCYGYLGYKEPYLCYALVRWTIAASRVKITDTLDVLYAIKHELPYYNYKSGELALDDYIDKIHNFCDDCLDQFDFAQVWFADRLAGNCIGANCKTIVAEDFTFSL